MPDVDEIISEMTKWEKGIMTIIGRISASPNKNFTRQTVKKKASDKELPHVDNVLDSLRKKGLIRYYRAPDNFAASHIGFLVAKRLREEFLKDKYDGLRIHGP